MAAEQIGKYLQRNHVSFSGFAVNRKYHSQNSIYGKPCYVIEDYLKENKCNVIIGFAHYNDSLLEKVNKENIVKLYKFDFWGRFVLHEDNSWSEDFVARNHEKIAETKSWMSDEKSKKALSDFMEQKQTSCYRKDYDRTPQYFDSYIVHYGKEEFFIDCGAYHGETSLEFIESLKKQGISSFLRIIAFEPDEKNANTMKENFKGIKNVEVHVAGVSDRTGVLSFSSGKEMSSKFVEDGDIKVPVEAIDDIEGSEKITFIKMDIEGSELDALHGAARTIRRNRPKLAVCVYHKKEDLITIPQYIKELNPDYRLYFRNYNFAGTEAVLYAV